MRRLLSADTNRSGISGCPNSIKMIPLVAPTDDLQHKIAACDARSKSQSAAGNKIYRFGKFEEDVGLSPA
jgi:hypothetical protein